VRRVRRQPPTGEKIKSGGREVGLDGRDHGRLVGNLLNAGFTQTCKDVRYRRPHEKCQTSEHCREQLLRHKTSLIFVHHAATGKRRSQMALYGSSRSLMAMNV